MRHRHFLFSVAITAIALSSCHTTTYYQVYEMKTPELTTKESCLTYDNEDCSIMYNLWAPGGDASFLISNKTGKNLYVVLSKSFFIMNGVANDYYTGSIYGKSVSSLVSSLLSESTSVSRIMSNDNRWFPLNFSRGVNMTAGLSVVRSVETKEQEIVCVPPFASKSIPGFNIYNDVYKVCDHPRRNYPKTSSNPIVYSESNTPIIFRNRIAYTFDEEAKDIKYLENKFWLSSIQNFKDKSATRKETYEDCESHRKNSYRSFTVSAPNKFYNTYKVNPDAKGF